MDHADLVSEINMVEKMTPAERLKHAKKRRAYQLKQYNHYEKKIDKECSKKRKHTHLNNMKRPSKRHKKGNVDFVDNVKILEAAARNDVEEVRVLLMNSVDPNLTNEDGLTALHQCCIDESKELLALLLEYGADVNARDSELWTPLHAAATCGHIQLCEMLVDQNADLLAVNADGNMPYDICEDEDTLDFVENEMAKRGITQEEIDDTRLVTERQMLDDLKDFVSQGGKLENIRDQNGVSPLHIAAANGYLEVGSFLLENKIPVNIRDDDSWEPIHAAACWQQSLMLDLLVKHGADIDSKTKMHDTPFDICEDPDIKQKILDMKDELENRKKKSSGSVRRSSRPNNRSLSNSPMSYLFNSNNSISDKAPFSASMRRSSMRGEKSALFMKEVKEEAAHFGLISGDSNEDIPDEEDESDDDEDDDEEEEHGIANVNDVELILDDMNGNMELHDDKRPGPSLLPRPDSSHPRMNGNHPPSQESGGGKRVIPPLRELGEGVCPRSGSSTQHKQPSTIITSLLTPAAPSSSRAGGKSGTSSSSSLSQQKMTVDSGTGTTPSTRSAGGGETRPLVMTGGKATKPSSATSSTAAATAAPPTGKSNKQKTTSTDSLSGGKSKGSSALPSKSSSSTAAPLSSKSSSKTNITGSSSGISSAKGTAATNPKAPAPSVLKEKSKENADPSLLKHGASKSSVSHVAATGTKTSGTTTSTGRQSVTTSTSTRHSSTTTGASSQSQLNIPSALNESSAGASNNSSSETPKLKPRSDSRYPTGGGMTGTTLSDLKRQRMSQYNRSGTSSCNGGTNNNSAAGSSSGAGSNGKSSSSLDAEIQNMFLTNVVGGDRSPAHSPSLGRNGRKSGPPAPPSGSSDNKRNSNANLNKIEMQGTANNNNNTATTGSRTSVIGNGSQQSMRKFSASSSVQVIGGDEGEKRNCCIII